MTPVPGGEISTSDVWTAPAEPVEQELPEVEVVEEEAKDDLSELS